MPSLRSLVGALVAALALTLVAGASAAAGPDLTRSLKAGGLVARLPARRHGLLEARPGSRRRLGLLDAAEPLRPGPRRRARDRARRAPARAPRRNGLLERVLPHARDGAARIRPRDRPARRSSTRSRPSTTPRWRAQIRNARRLFGTKPAAGTLTVLVTHGVVVQETSGQTLEEGEAIVFRPLGNSRFRVVGRVMPRSGARFADRPRRQPSASPFRSTRSPAGTHPHDVRRRTRRDGLVHGAAHRQARSARPEDRDRRRRSRSATARRRTASSSGPTARAWVTDGGLNAIVRVDPGTSAFRGFRLPASTGNANLNTATLRQAAASSGSRARTASTAD